MTDAGISRLLASAWPGLTVRVEEECPSTNTCLKERLRDLPHGYVLIARRQSAGRGRLGRSFFSPDGTGLYMSVLLRPDLDAGMLTLITPAAAVAVRRAIRDLSGVDADIKWVNDLLIGGRKVCGILTECGFSGGGAAWAVLGIGVNVCPPEGGFPPELRDAAGAVLPDFDPEARWRLANLILRRFFEIYEALPGRAFVREYREANCVIGREVDIICGGVSRPALALDISPDCALLVRYPDGREERICAGEVSLRIRGAGR